MKPRFAEWAKAYGIPKLARDLGVSPKAPYHWISGKKGQEVFPRPETVAKIIELSRGELTVNDVLTFVPPTPTTKSNRRKPTNG